MFGFLRPAARTDTYRRAYARCCQFVHDHYGIGATLALSYEAVFLYCLGQDAGWVPSLDVGEPRCCRLRSGRRLRGGRDEDLGRLCSAVGLFLARVKLEDDIQDERSWSARYLLWHYGRRFSAVDQELDRDGSDYVATIRQLMARHAAMEAAGRAVPLAEFAEPTAEGFARTFRLFAERFDDPCRADLEEIGYAIGFALIAFDCAADWERDRARRAFNPLRSRRARDDAHLESQRQLTVAGFRCRELFGAQALTVSVLRSVLEGLPCRGRVRRQRPRPALVGLGRAALARRGDCDCGGCDCLCDAGGGCCDNGPHGCGNCLEGCAACGEGCSACPCDICCCDGCGSQRNPTNVQSNVTASSQTIVGMEGVAVGPLNPMGMVRVGSKNLPAKSEDGAFVQDGGRVLITGEDGFGVVVRAVGGTEPPRPPELPTTSD